MNIAKIYLNFGYLKLLTLKGSNIKYEFALTI